MDERVKPDRESCPKCGETVFTGPIYRPRRPATGLYGETFFVREEEGLEWACGRCGWLHRTPPLDYVEAQPRAGFAVYPPSPPPTPPGLADPNTPVPDGPFSRWWRRFL